MRRARSRTSCNRRRRPRSPTVAFCRHPSTDGPASVGGFDRRVADGGCGARRAGVRARAMRPRDRRSACSSSVPRRVGAAGTDTGLRRGSARGAAIRPVNARQRMRRRFVGAAGGARRFDATHPAVREDRYEYGDCRRAIAVRRDRADPATRQIHGDGATAARRRSARRRDRAARIRAGGAAITCPERQLHIDVRPGESPAGPAANGCDRGRSDVRDVRA